MISKGGSHFSDEVKKYKDDHYGVNVYSPSYADIGDYLSGHLSTDREIDLEWILNERDVSLFSKEIRDEISEFCQRKIFEEGKNYIDEDDSFPLW